MAAPNSSYVVCFPLTEQIWDRDLNVPLAAGVVTFFSDFARTMPKNVYAQSRDPMTGNFSYPSIGSTLILSSIGTFVDGSGANIIPFLWPFVGDPITSPSTMPQPYYITVTSASPDLRPQFTVDNWPPNVTESNSSGSGVNSVMVHTYPSGTTTYTPTTGLVYAVFECMGSGAGGAGTANTGGTDESVGGGGGAGGYSRKTVLAANISGPQLVTVGGFGAGGAAGNNNGTDGNASSVGSLCVANGGSGGLAPDARTGGAGGTAGIGDIAATGMNGEAGLAAASINTVNFQSGTGGSTQWGSGGHGGASLTTGTNATGYGCGGGGGGSSTGGGAAAGGNGSAGFVIITEYISA